MQMQTYKVYVRTNADGNITAVNSDAFLTELTGWTQIDEGTGDRYHHAQGNYFPLPAADEYGVYRYKLVDGVAADNPDYAQAVAQAQADADKAAQITALKKQLADTDYTVIKIAEGAATKEDYATVIAQREAWRAEINALGG